LIFFIVDDTAKAKIAAQKRPKRQFGHFSAAIIRHYNPNTHQIGGSMTIWHHLAVIAPPGNGYTTPQTVKRIDEHLVSKFTVMGASFVTENNGNPAKRADGSFEVHADETCLTEVKYILTAHYGLTVQDVTPKQ
jgi:hypothetical protein